MLILLELFTIFGCSKFTINFIKVNYNILTTVQFCPGGLLSKWSFVRGWHFWWSFVRWSYVWWSFVHTPPATVNVIVTRAHTDKSAYCHYSQ